MSETAIEVPQPESIVHLVAKNTEQMSQAKDSLDKFLCAKLKAMRSEREELIKALETAKRNKWATTTYTNQVNRTKRRIMFYEKVRDAVLAGYTLVPNFPVDIFAIRVCREKPTASNSLTTENVWSHPSLRQESSDVVPAGEGRYQSPTQLAVTDENEFTKDGKKMWCRTIEATDFAEVEFPLIAAIPEVMTATAEAMALRVFDQIGVCPQRTRKGDPLIIGQIVLGKSMYGVKTASFLIAWHLDLRTL